MSQFSEKLKYFTGNCGTTIYQLSQNADLDRTTIQHSISGKRLPNIKFVEKLCNYLRISPNERNELMEMYNMSKIGDNIYYRRKYVKELLEQMADLHLTREKNTNINTSFNISGDIEQNVKVFSGEYNVNNIIFNVLYDEVFNAKKPYIGLTVPFEYSFLYSCLKQLYWESNEKLLIEHIVKFNKDFQNQQNPNKNLKILSNVLPLAFCLGTGYQPYYYYSVIDEFDNIESVMPYFLFTGRRLITISDDFKTAILYNNNDIFSVFSVKFQNLLIRSTPLIIQLSDCFELSMNYRNAYTNFGEVTNVMEPNPCLGRYYTREIIEKYLRQDLPYRNDIKLILYDFYFNMDKYAPFIRSYFSVDGLNAFVNTGKLAELPVQYADSFSVKDRKNILSALINDIQNKPIIFRALNPSKIRISALTSIQTYKKNNILFCAADLNNIVSCNISEQSVCEAFNDFFDVLPDSDLVYSKEETIRVLESVISKL